MELRRYKTPDAFLVDAEPFLLGAEAENAVMLGFARALARGAPSPAMEPYFAAVLDDDGVCAAAFQTLPTKLGVTNTRRSEAWSRLAADVQVACPHLKAVLGPEPGSRTFAECLAALRGQRAVPAMRQRIYELREVTTLTRPPGMFRQASTHETDLLAHWVTGFLADIGDTGDPRALVTERIAGEQLFVWDDEGPKSMAAWTGKTATGVRVNFVYTPPELRGRGYATAVVAALSQWMLDHGSRFCCLYTDLANRTSNAIYQRIGYRPVTDAGFYRLTT